MNKIMFIKTNRAYYEDFVSRSTYHSNSIEGSTLTLGETHALLFGDNTMQIHATSREIFDAINHKKAMDVLLEALLNQDLNLSERLIKDLNEIINSDILNTSGYRKVSVMIRGADHLPPAPAQVPNLMMYFIDNYNQALEGSFQDVYLKIARFHIDFEKIHPFEDGNGRTGRLLMNYELLKHNMAPIVIPISKRAEYFEFISSNDILGFAKFVEQLSAQENERMDQMVEINKHELLSKRKT